MLIIIYLEIDTAYQILHMKSEIKIMLTIKHLEMDTAY